jgi:hypothetical protein
MDMVVSGRDGIKVQLNSGDGNARLDESINLLEMPLVPFKELPPDARIWVFGADAPVTGAAADTLLAEVDQYLDQWKAHGFPLKAARDWRENRFLVIGIDPTEEQASGCSIDGLFRQLQQVQRSVGAQLVGGGRVFYRDAKGETRVTSREEFGSVAHGGRVKTVFDTSLTKLDDLPRRFERPLRESWASSLG